MATNKRRKLDGSGSSTPTAMSAFAARQQLWGVAAARNNEVEKVAPEPATGDVVRSRKSETPSARSVASRSRRQSPEEPVAANSKQAQGIDGEKGASGPTTPRPEPSGVLIKQHSSFKPGKKNLQRKAGGRVVITTHEAERLVVLGSFGIKVREGEATFAGAILTPLDPVQWVHASHCHAVPVLRAADQTVLELQPHPAAKGLRQLAALNPAFAKLWNESPETNAKSKSPATFQIIYTSQDVPKRAVLQELASPAAWNKKLSGLAAAKRKATPVVFLCGPKSSGKSTFGRLLTSRFITDRGGSKNKPWSTVMVLDIDPGQPEYSPPGVISLSKITNPNLSPSFCHPTLPPADQLRAHAIASVTPALDPAHYIECVLDLLAHYQRSPEDKSPLVVNTPGWVQGTGLDILTELITAIRPTEVIYMSQDGPEETVNSLQSACTTTPPTPFSTLPSQPSEASSSRTSLHFRTMQTMSYFHLRQPSQQQSYPTWDPTPLSDLRPWRVRHTGNNRGFLGILCYDHQPAPELLAEAINGTVLALVQLESRAALRGLLPPVSGLPDSNFATPSSPTNAPNTASNPLSQNAATPNPQLPRTPHPKKKETTTEAPQVPLIPNPQGLTLSPAHSRLLSLVLVRGIDTVRGELQLLTPLPAEVIATLGGEGKKEVVLVAGRFDTPAWAYTEGLFRSRATASGEGSKGGEVAEDDDDGEEDEEDDGGEDGGEREGGDGTGDVPWVEMLHGSQRRAAGSKVWRVRRDLGRN